MKIFTLTTCWGRQHGTQTLSPRRASICLLFHLGDLFKKEPCWDHIGLAPSYWNTTITLKTQFSCSKLWLLSVIRPSVSCICSRWGLQLLPSLPPSTCVFTKQTANGSSATIRNSRQRRDILGNRTRAGALVCVSRRTKPGLGCLHRKLISSLSAGCLSRTRSDSSLQDENVNRHSGLPAWVSVSCAQSSLTFNSGGDFRKKKERKKKDLSGDWWCRPALMSQARSCSTWR